MSDRELVLKSDDLFYVGELPWDSVRSEAAGLYFRDTRYLNGIAFLLNGAAPEVLATSQHSASAATITGANPAVAGKHEHIPPHTVAIDQRIVLDTSLNLSCALQNFGRDVVHVELSLLCSADFRDVFDIRGFPRQTFGTLLLPNVEGEGVQLRYRAFDDLVLSTSISFDRKPEIQLRRVTNTNEEVLAPLQPGVKNDQAALAPDDMASVLVSFPVALEPGERWELRATVSPDRRDDRRVLSFPVPPPPQASDTSISTDNPLFDRVLQRSQADLAALMTRFPHGTLPAAGIPWYVAPFGRDSLITALQTLHLSPEIAEGTLRVLASLQGTTIDPETEEEPGKILHEMRYGEMARSGEIPHRPYFGSVDATPLFVLLFAETVAWTANDALYADLLPNVMAALEWIERFGDANGDGMIDYDAEPVSGIRIRHRVWKDSIDSLKHIDGREPRGRVSPVEVQGYVYAACRRLARVASTYGNTELARMLDEKADNLSTVFEREFWMDDQGFYAQALDGDGAQMQSITSNPGHLLVTGIAAPERASAVARRLRRPDIESGWGIRTLSAASTSYNPMSYHNGSVWPHDNSLIAYGCYRIGEKEIGNEIFTAMFDACRLSANERLNELYCGFGRDGSGVDVPVPYPTAGSPQAWAAGTLPYLVRGALGLDVDPERRILRVDPYLPAFLSEVEIHDFSVLGSTGRLLVRRNGTSYSIEADNLPLQL